MGLRLTAAFASLLPLLPLVLGSLCMPVYLDDAGRQKIGDILDVITGAVERCRTCANVAESWIPGCSGYILRNLRANLDLVTLQIQVLRTFLWVGSPGTRVLNP